MDSGNCGTMLTEKSLSFHTVNGYSYQVTTLLVGAALLAYLLHVTGYANVHKSPDCPEYNDGDDGYRRGVLDVGTLEYPATAAPSDSHPKQIDKPDVDTGEKLY